MTGHETPDPFEHDDAAYVLGALPEPERALFVAHLGGCAACRQRVVELAEARAALAELGDLDDLGDLAELGDPPDAAPVPETLLPGLLRRAATEGRRRRRVVRALAGVAAVSVVALVLVLSPVLSSVLHPGHDAAPALAMTALAPVPVSATAVLHAETWGTRVELRCRYDTGGAWSQGVTYALHAVDRAGTVHDLGSWTMGAGTGQEMTFVGGTSVTRDDVSRLEVTLPDGTPVLRLAT